MAFNPSPEVAAARKFAKQFKAKQVVLLYLVDEGPDNYLHYASYGATQKLCDEAEPIADLMFATWMKKLAEEV